MCSSHAQRLQRLRGLYGIVDDDARFSLAPLDWARALAEGGARTIQLRFKRTPMGEALRIARAVREALPSVLLIVNDRVDLALACRADGVHLGADDLPSADARRLLGADLLVGGTARDPDQARALLAAGADHLGVGPVFASTTKPLAHPPLGPAGLRAICEAVAPAPVVAISGIDANNIAEIAAAGARAAAVIGAVGLAPDPAEAARRLARAFES